MKEHREKSPIPFFLQTSLSLSYLPHNSMSKELFRKALKCKKRNKKQEEKINWREKKGKENLLTVEMGALSKINKKEEEKLEGDLSFTLSNFFHR